MERGREGWEIIEINGEAQTFHTPINISVHTCTYRHVQAVFQIFSKPLRLLWILVCFIV